MFDTLCVFFISSNCVCVDVCMCVSLHLSSSSLWVFFLEVHAHLHCIKNLHLQDLQLSRIKMFNEETAKWKICKLLWRKWFLKLKSVKDRLQGNWTFTIVYMLCHYCTLHTFERVKRREETKKWKKKTEGRKETRETWKEKYINFDVFKIGCYSKRNEKIDLFLTNFLLYFCLLLFVDVFVVTVQVSAFQFHIILNGTEIRENQR